MRQPIAGNIDDRRSGPGAGGAVQQREDLLEKTRRSRKTDTVLAVIFGGGVLGALIVLSAPDRAARRDAALTALLEGADRPVEVAERSDPAASTDLPAVPGPRAAAGDVAERTEPEGEAFSAASGRAPSFDIVRVEPDGSAVVAGFADPEASIEILLEGSPIATTQADADGNFVAFFDADPSAAPVALSMKATGADAEDRHSEEVVMLLPNAEAATGETGSGAGAPEVAATAIVRRDSVEVISSLDAEEFIAADQVTLASISYTPQGQIELSGAGPVEGALRVYVNNDLVAEGAIGKNGRWLARLDDIAAGLHRLRIDQVHADGRVASRVETPFQRDLPTGPRPRPGETLPGHAPGILATVQPGGTLWTLSRVHYGSGVHFSLIFTANRELIRDPNLIYPGQVLTIPGLE